MPSEYTPSGSTITFTIPSYDEVEDGPGAFEAFADDIAEYLDALSETVAAAAISGFTQQSGTSYTLALADASKIAVEISNASPNTITVPTNASVPFPIGTQITIVQTGGGQTTIVPAGGVTVNGTPGLKLRTQWATAVLTKRATNTWLLVGDTAV